MINGNKDHKRSGEDWSWKYAIEIISPDGWQSIKEFKMRKISYHEFLNRCAASVIVPPKNLTRRDAAILHRKLNKI